MVTKAGTSEYKGYQLFAVYNEDENGDLGEYPIVSFGLKKAQALLNHLDDFEEWCEGQGLEKMENLDEFDENKKQGLDIDDLIS